MEAIPVGPSVGAALEMSLPEVGRCEMIGIEEEDDGGGSKGCVVWIGASGRDMIEEGRAGFEEERDEEGLGKADRGGIEQELRGESGG